MGKLLLVGDVHAVQGELDDCHALMAGIVATVRAEKPDAVVFLGDQYNNHAIVHVDVMAFWRAAFYRLRMTCPVYALVGNHDMPGDQASKATSMSAHADSIVVVHHNAPVEILPGVAAVPYCHDRTEFLGLCRGVSGAKTVLCHQTFDGGKYENGFYAEDGVDLKELPEGQTYISGHIHTPQEFGSVKYIGAPRWRSSSDADIDRAIWLVEFDVTGREVSCKSFDTSAWCQKLITLRDTEDAPAEPPQNPRWKAMVDILGTERWIEARKAFWAGKARYRAFRTDTAVSVKVRESEGLAIAFRKFLEGSKSPKHGTTPELLAALAKQRMPNLWT